MRRALAICLLLAGCGGSQPPEPKDLLGQLQAIPGVTVTPTPTQTPGFDYYVLQFTQPVDHADPNGPTFQQEVSLLHRSVDAPMVVQTSGYFDYYTDHPVELTNILAGNQISIEHRFFGTSRPDPADWSKLTIEQMANDEHVIIAALRDIYGGAFLTTGGSKGGMTATYHRRFFPDDVDGTVPYVAPMSFGAPDTRYTAFVDAIGTQPCRDALRGAAVEMLKNRRTAMEQHAAAQTGHIYTRVALGPAVEISIESLEWAFWQYFGETFCAQVPAATATDDDQVAAFEAYYFQAYAQLGYPEDNAHYLDAFHMYTDADFDGALPTNPPPAYDSGAAMHDVDNFVQTAGSRLLFIYGEWDPWSGGKYTLGNATDSALFVQTHGTHGSRIGRLEPADRDAALAKLADWTGVLPQPAKRTVREVPEPVEPRVPPVLMRAMRRH